MKMGRRSKTTAELKTPLESIIHIVHDILELFISGLISTEVAKYILIAANDDFIMESPVDHGTLTLDARNLLDFAFKELETCHA